MEAADRGAPARAGVGSDEPRPEDAAARAAWGPRLRLVGPGDVAEIDDGANALDTAARLLRAGAIVAIRGAHGFHLAVDATDEEAVRRLRHRKRRDGPLAVMVATVAEARTFARVDDAEAALLRGGGRPIVLLRRTAGAPLAPSVAPGLATIGVMTPPTPLHRFLLAGVRRPLVMTSGNPAAEPIAGTTDEGLARLGRIADAFLLHDGAIRHPRDDSVLRLVDGEPVVLRRARGYAPAALPLPVGSPVPLLAVGPTHANTFTLAAGRHAYVSEHIGDLEPAGAAARFRTTVAAYRRLLQIEPEVAVLGGRPASVAARMAEALDLGGTLVVPHHHAHVAAVAAEHGETERVVGVVLDGADTSDGADGGGADVLVADLVEYRRIGHLAGSPRPGGTRAGRQPWRAALGYLSLAPEMSAAFARAWTGVPPEERRVAARQTPRRQPPEASSLGRLFDAAAAVLGVRATTRYAGQAAMELEALAGDHPGDPLPFPIIRHPDGRCVLEPLPLLSALGSRAAAGDALHGLAARFHESVAASVARLAAQVCRAQGIGTVALSGSMFENARLLRSVRRHLGAARLRVLVPHRLGFNDGAISYGQAAVAAARLRHPPGA